MCEALEPGLLAVGSRVFFFVFFGFWSFVLCFKICKLFSYFVFFVFLFGFVLSFICVVLFSCFVCGHFFALLSVFALFRVVLSLRGRKIERV